jgi:hypothetical protein
VRRRCATVALLICMLGSSVVTAQSTGTTACRASRDRKAILAHVVDAQTGAPIAGVYAILSAQRLDTTFHAAGGFSIPSDGARVVEIGASGQACFTNLAPGDYLFAANASRHRSRQAIPVRLTGADTLKVITLRYRPFGNSTDEDSAAANLLRALERNQRRWVERRPSHYLLRVKRDCFCFIGPPSTYEVLNGIAIAATDSGGVRRIPSRAERGMTVDSLFKALRGNILDESRVVGAIRYDQRFGLPSHYETDSKAAITDSWEKVTVERFDVLE